MAAARVEVLGAHLSPAAAAATSASASLKPAQRPKADDDVVIVAAVRTAITKGRRGAFKDTVPEDLLAVALKAVTEKVNLDKKLVQDIQVGNVLPAGGGATVARMATFYAGFPETTSLATLNRQCSSGLQAVANVAAAIHAGFIDIGIGAGVESMSMAPENKHKFSKQLKEVPDAADCLIPMGITSENVAEQFGISRGEQDALAFHSNERALRAQKLGLFTEIVPVTTKVLDAEGKEKTITVTKDEGPREGTTMEGLAKLPGAFKKGGCTTAGNSSQVSDGAAAVLLMRRSKAKELGLKPLARFLAMSVVGVPPRIMGIGPAKAIPAVLAQAGLTKDQIDVFELNEAFASQAAYCCNVLGLDMTKVNPLGGAIALGHPLGCTGARQIATILPELERRKGRYGILSMCIGTGMGAAAVIERE